MEHDILDRLVAEYSDRLAAGGPADRSAFLARVPPADRPALERCLKMIEAGLARVPAGAALAPGLRLDQFELVREIGRGGMALVWLARDLELKRPVALKILRPGLALEQRHADRFRREGLAIARLRHANIVQIHGVGEAHGYHYLAMEYVEGPSFATVLEALAGARGRDATDLARASGVPELGLRGGTYEQAVARLLAPVAQALSVAHEAGLVHRDVKPSNILIHRDGRAVIADFGLAKGEGDPALSLTGDALGTPYYMSPEQAYVSGRAVDHRTDVYSLGVTLYEALSGRRPFGGASFLEVIESIRNTVPPSVRSVAPWTSRDAAALVRKAMARNPDERFGTARELCDDLVALSESRTTKALEHEGGLVRRAWTQLRAMGSGHPYEYRSARTFLGLPLVHVISGPRVPGRRRVARGWIAHGDVAIGGIASGPIALGGIALGGIGVGLVFTWAGIGVGMTVCAGIGLGYYVFAGLAIGYFAFGGIALGYGALGGIARGIYVAGGNVAGVHVLSDKVHDPEALRFFSESIPWFLKLAGVGRWFGGS
jgi:serine/threonine protein kinase